MQSVYSTAPQPTGLKRRRETTGRIELTNQKRLKDNEIDEDARGLTPKR